MLRALPQDISVLFVPILQHVKNEILYSIIHDIHRTKLIQEAMNNWRFIVQDYEDMLFVPYTTELIVCHCICEHVHAGVEPVHPLIRWVPAHIIQQVQNIVNQYDWHTKHDCLQTLRNLDWRYQE